MFYRRFVHFFLLFFFCSCASVPQPKKLSTDEDYFNHAMGFFIAKNYFDAIPAFEELKEKFPLSPYAVLAELRLGDSHYFKGEYIEATHYYENFRRLHPSNKYVPYSIYMTGMCFFRQMLTVDRDQTFAKEAAEQFQLVIDLYPKTPYAGKALCKLTEAKKRIAEHEFFVAKFYLQYKDYKGAIERLNTILQHYPFSIKRDKILFYLGKAVLLSNDRLKGEKILELLIRRYPNSAYVHKARALLGRSLAEKNIIEPQDNKNNKKHILFF